MAGRIPLTDLWRLSGDSVFADDAPALSGNGFRLPGADALEGFSGLLGDTDAPETEEKPERPFPLPMMLPEHFPGKVSLRAELPLRQCASEHAELVFSGLYGRGTIRCGESLTRIFSGPSDLTLDVSGCLCSPSPVFVTVGFSADRPAGVDGGVSLHLWTDACITSLSCPKGSIRVSLKAEKAGRYRLLLRQLAPDDLIWFPEVELSLSAGESRGLCLPAGPVFGGW